MTVEALIAEALALPADQRARLAARLLSSLYTQPASSSDSSGDLPKGVPVYGRGKGKLRLDMDDNSHLADFAEYME